MPTFVLCVVVLKEKRNDEPLAPEGSLELMRISVPGNQNFMYLTEFALQFTSTIKRSKRRTVSGKLSSSSKDNSHKTLAKFQPKLSKYGPLENVMPGWKSAFVTTLTPNTELQARQTMVQKGSTIMTSKEESIWASIILTIQKSSYVGTSTTGNQNPYCSQKIEFGFDVGPQSDRI